MYFHNFILSNYPVTYHTLVMNKKHILLFFWCILLFNKAFTQVSVSPLTGAASVNIPIYTVKSGQVTLPVSLSYDGSGVKPKDSEGSAGMGWQLNAGGQITRVVRGLPDDCTKDDSSKQRLGWMSKLDTAANKISGFAIANNGSTCSYETSDISYITTNFPFKDDTEPDMFYVSAPGLSCQLVYDRADSVFRPVNYQDLVITYTTVGTGNNASNIASFTITNDKGVKYLFSYTSTTNETSKAPVGGVGQYFNRRYLQYINGISYCGSWSLTSITDVNGNGVTLVYGAYPASLGADSVGLYLGGSGNYTLQYRTLRSVQSPCLYYIQAFNNISSKYVLQFYWNTLNAAGQTGQTVLDSISGNGRHFTLNYSAVEFTTPSGYAYKRNFLRNLTDNGCGTPINYQFLYNGETGNINNYLNSYTTILPDSSSTQRDYWGYYSSTAPIASLMPKVWISGNSPSIPPYSIYESNTGVIGTYPYYTIAGNIRAADPTRVMAGSLTKIINAQGGSSNIVYESNDYVDGPSGAVVQGGGIRVKQLIDSAGNGSSNNTIRNYTYLNPSTGLSSGKPISLPQFAFTIPYSGALTGNYLWNANSALSAYDLSGEDHTIMYQYTKVSQTGAGSSLYQYTVPATAWDNSATPSCSGCATVEWGPTISYVARNNCSSTYGPIANTTWNYPFIPNLNYDFERGLPVKTINYNDSGTEVSETDYTYQRSYPPIPIAAFKTDNDPSGSLVITAYNKYNVFYNTSELTATVINKVFDSQTLSVSRSDTATYTYGGANHKLVTQIQSRNSDQSVLTSKISYTKDYTAVSGTNSNVTAIYNLQQENVNVPLESYQQVTRAGSTYTTAANLTLFKGVTQGSTTFYLPSQQLKLVQPDGITNFAPYTISGQTSTNDSRYFAVANYDTYDNTGFLVTVDDNYKHISTTLLNHLVNQPIAQFSNAAYSEVAYSGFDSDVMSPAYGFNISGSGSYTAVGSHSGNAAGLATTQTVTSPTLTKNAIAANYIFSIWINSTTAGTLTLTLTGISTHPTVSYTGTGTWNYYELKIPVSTLSSSYTVSFTGTTNISMDDILFYPDVAQASTATYDGVTNYKLAQTNTNGVSTYFINDQWGRVLYTLDQDKNIAQKNTYLTTSDVQAFSYASISVPSNLQAGSAAGFGIAGPNTCSSAGATVTWHWGDGTTSTSALLATASHTYTTSGKKGVTATINSPAFGTLNLGPDSVTVTPVSIHITHTNHTYSNGTITTIRFTNLNTGGSYSFTEATLNNTYITPGKYLITVTFSTGSKYVAGSGSTGSGYGCINLSGDCWTGCSQYQTSNNYSYTADLTSCTTLDISVYQTYTCGS